MRALWSDRQNCSHTQRTPLHYKYFGIVNYYAVVVLLPPPPPTPLRGGKMPANPGKLCHGVQHPLPGHPALQRNSTTTTTTTNSSSSATPRWTQGSPPRGQQRQLGNDISSDSGSIRSVQLGYDIRVRMLQQ